MENYKTNKAKLFCGANDKLKEKSNFRVIVIQVFPFKNCIFFKYSKFENISKLVYIISKQISKQNVNKKA